MRSYNLGIFWKDVAVKHRTQPALVYTDETLTYGELDGLSDQLALFLMENGVARGEVIAIAHEKQPLSYALMLAALKIGAPYVVIDAGSPVERLRKILATAKPKLLFYDSPGPAAAMAELGNAARCPVIFLTPDLLPQAGAEDAEELETRIRSVDGATLAYIMFTSGSTGSPKGVAISHDNLPPFIAWGQECFAVEPTDIFANLSPMYFDNSVFDFYVGLFSGAALAPVARPLLQTPFELVQYVGERKCTLWFSVPSLLIYLMTMKVMRPEFLPTIRSISFGGEGYPKVELKKLFDLFSPQARIVNVYGPTECTCICSSYQLHKADFSDLEGLPPLGRLNPNFDYEIESLEGGQGELILMGPNVGTGYFNDAERTRAAFFLCQDSRRYGKHAYRTGDIVTEKNGLLFFVGRADNQIKHMGYRIELEEIEHAIMRLPGVSQCAAVYVRQDAAFGKIYAFAACAAGKSERELLHDLAALLPAYMIPSRLEIMPQLPKNANGKIDRQALKTMCCHP